MFSEEGYLVPFRDTSDQEDIYDSDEITRLSERRRQRVEQRRVKRDDSERMKQQASEAERIRKSPFRVEDEELAVAIWKACPHLGPLSIVRKDEGKSYKPLRDELSSSAVSAAMTREFDNPYYAWTLPSGCEWKWMY